MLRLRIKLLVVVAVAALISACGFRLVGAELATAVVVDYDSGYQVVEPILVKRLRQQLRHDEAQKAAESPSIRIVSIRQGNELLSVDSDGAGIEYEVIIDVTWEFRLPGEAIERQSMRARRSYGYDRSQALAEQQERKLLAGYLHEELAERIGYWVESRLKRK